ncbi:hypothetical protein CRG98_012635 [Punica granatum]|uniref:Uncharacterized protein n=1 Tax=Punica granatum TaxID=22663 RepID=A0A2I0KFA3_PUNGR|nr:hypothetical protein CRG98_012635 [Punica granatum]
MTDSVGVKQTRLAPDEETTLREAPGGLLVQDRWHWTPNGMRITPVEVLCMVERLSARNHLVTGESEGCEEPLESDGTTRLSREIEKTLRKPGIHS